MTIYLVIFAKLQKNILAKKKITEGAIAGPPKRNTEPAGQQTRGKKKRSQESRNNAKRAFTKT